jgi:hypothetical protein
MNLSDLDGLYACQMCFAPLKFDRSLLDVDVALLHDNFERQFADGFFCAV